MSFLLVTVLLTWLAWGKTALLPTLKIHIIRSNHFPLTNVFLRLVIP